MPQFLDDYWTPGVSKAGSSLLSIPDTEDPNIAGVGAHQAVDEGVAGGRVGDGKSYLLQNVDKRCCLVNQRRDVPPPASDHRAKLSEVIPRTGQTDWNVHTERAVTVMARVIVRRTIQG